MEDDTDDLTYQSDKDQEIGNPLLYNHIDLDLKGQSIKNYTNFPDFKEFTLPITLIQFFSKMQTKLLIKKTEVQSTTKSNRKTIDLQIQIGKVHQFLMSEVKSMHSETYEKNLDITINKITYSLIFHKLMDKYIFESLYYNLQLNSISRDYFNKYIKLNVSILTWNLSTIKLPDLSSLFRSGTLNNVDIFAFGMQECKVLQLNQWVQSLKTLLEYYGFNEIANTSLYQMFIVVFIKKDLYPLVTNIETDKKAMGFANLLGNKGGMIVSFRLLGFLFVFINCHLAAKVFKTLERNQMAQNFVKSIRVSDKITQIDVLADYIFWFGDLNYRVDFPFHETIMRLNNNNLKDLRDKDQLRKQINLNKIFSHFREKQIEFSPTYRRRQIGIDEDGNSTQKKKNKEKNAWRSLTVKNNLSQELNSLIIGKGGKYDSVYNNKDDQSPSWCDRILVKTDRNCSINYYNSIKDIKFSDHLPVQCSYSIYLTLPIIKNFELNDMQITGLMSYEKIKLKYNIAESDFIIKYPVKFIITGYYLANDYPVVTKSMNIESENNMPFLGGKKDWIEVPFDNFKVEIPPKVIFDDFTQMRAFNMFFVIKMNSNKEDTEIGYSKYSFEQTEKTQNLLDFQEKLRVYYLLREMGVFSFKASYNYSEKTNFN